MTNVPKRLVTGTNADLRKLPLKEAKEICREYGVREEEVLITKISVEFDTDYKEVLPINRKQKTVFAFANFCVTF